MSAIFPDQFSLFVSHSLVRIHCGILRKSAVRRIISFDIFYTDVIAYNQFVGNIILEIYIDTDTVTTGFFHDTIVLVEFQINAITEMFVTAFQISAVTLIYGGLQRL